MRPCQKIKGLIIAINRTKRGAEPPFYALLPDSKFYAGWFCLHISALRRSCCRRNLAFSPMQFSYWCLALTASDLSLLHGIFSRPARRINAMILLRGGLIAAILCALLTVLCAWVQLPIPALVALFFTIAFCSGIGTVGGAEAMSAVGTQESGTASALMGMSMFVFGGIAHAIVGNWRRNTVKNESGNYGVLYAGIVGCSHQNRQSKVMNTSS